MHLLDEARAFFDGRAEPQVRAVPGRRMFGPPQDEDTGPYGQALDADVEGLSMEIVYRDASGAESVRTIRCHRLREDNGFYYVDAECMLRAASRTFRLDRIVEIRDYSTGEILTDIAGFFAPYLGENIALDDATDRRRKARSEANAHTAPHSVNPRVAAAFRDGARVLLFLAMSDGDLHEAERTMIVGYGEARLQRLREPPADPRLIVRRWVNNHVPTRASALAALGRLMANDADSEEIAHLMIDLIIADGTATDGEMAQAWALQAAMERRERVRPR